MGKESPAIQRLSATQEIDFYKASSGTSSREGERQLTQICLWKYHGQGVWWALNPWSHKSRIQQRLNFTYGLIWIKATCERKKIRQIFILDFLYLYNKLPQTFSTTIHIVPDSVYGLGAQAHIYLGFCSRRCHTTVNVWFWISHSSSRRGAFGESLASIVFLVGRIHFLVAV